MSKVASEASRDAEQESILSPSRIHVNINNIGSNDAEYTREFDRVFSTKDNVDEMSQPQKGTMMLNSKELRDEILSTIDDTLNHGSQAELLVASKQMTDFLVSYQSRWTPALSSSRTRTSGSVIVPINDINGNYPTGYSKSEQFIRCKLASLYRFIDLLRCSQGIYNHVTVRASQEQEHFLINPFGLMYHEITASSLVKVDISGNMIDAGSTTFGINQAGYTLHSAIHQARPDLKCVIHLHTPAVAAVSAMKCGLLPLSQEALICGKISYHDYCGILIDQDVKKVLVEDLGSINKVMILRNHGFVACGETVEEAWRYAFNMIKASETQVRAISVGIDQLYLQSDEKDKQIDDVLQGDTNEAISNKKWKTGELEFESLMRILDDAGYRTGYLYRQPLIRTIDRTTTITHAKVPHPALSDSPCVNIDTIVS